MHRNLTFAAVALLLTVVALTACQSTPDASPPVSATITTGDYVATATITRLNDPGQYRTEIRIERVDPVTGVRRILATPNIITLAGHPGSMSMQPRNEEEEIKVSVAIPELTRIMEGALISLEIARDGEIVTAPSILMHVPG